jgi:transcriptional regulator with XRE-family HTH domain
MWNKGKQMMKEPIFSIRLRDLRLKRNLNQADVSRQTGISSSAYNYYETGKRQPTITAIAKLADFYKVTADYLIGRTDVPDGLIITNLPSEFNEIGIKYITVSANELLKVLPKEIYDDILKSAKEKNTNE